MQIQANVNEAKTLYECKQVRKDKVRGLQVLSVTQNKLSKCNALETGTKGTALSPYCQIKNKKIT